MNRWEPPSLTHNESGTEEPGPPGARGPTGAQQGPHSLRPADHLGESARSERAPLRASGERRTPTGRRGEAMQRTIFGKPPIWAVSSWLPGKPLPKRVPTQQNTPMATSLLRQLRLSNRLNDGLAELLGSPESSRHELQTSPTTWPKPSAFKDCRRLAAVFGQI